MVSRSQELNGGAYARSVPVTGNHTLTAGGAGDNTQVDGPWMDRFIDSPHMGMWQSAKLILPFDALLAFGESITFSVQCRDADDIAGGGAANYGAASLQTAATGQSGGSHDIDTAEQDIGFEGARRFVQVRVTPNLTRSGTDSASWQACMEIYGLHQTIITKSPAPIATP